jgi:hypothetical protein
MAIGAIARALDAHGAETTIAALTLGVEAALAPIRAAQVAALAAVLAHFDSLGRSRAAPRLVAALRDWDAVADAADLARLDAGTSRAVALAAELHRRCA